MILGLIEALEVFTGLIIHADSKAEDKVRCKLVRSLIPSFVRSLIRPFRLQRNLVAFSDGSRIRNSMRSHLHLQNIRHQQ